MVELNLEMKKGVVRDLIGYVSNPEFLEWLEIVGYYDAPAAKNHHSNYRGGLFNHSLNVANQLIRLTEQLELSWDRPESPALVGLLHDVCKIDDYDYELNQETGELENIEYKPDLPGHGAKSIYMLCNRIMLTEEEKACIMFHMGAFTDKSEWNFYTKAIKQYPNVLFTHTADMIASNLMEE